MKKDDIITEKDTLVEEIKKMMQNSPSPSATDTMLSYIERKLAETHLLKTACLVILRDMEHKKDKFSHFETKWQRELNSVLFEIEVV